jgi:hypothetical protein
MKVYVVIDFPDMEPEGRHADYALECVTIDLKNGLDGYDWYIDEVTGD